MSTVATDGTVIVADGMSVSDTMCRRSVKLHAIGGTAIGFVGQSQDGYAFVDWMARGCPDPKPTVGSDFGALVVLADGSIQKWEDKLVPFPIHEPFDAIGSGRDFAVAAMHCGKSPIEAVRLAIKLCCCTGEPIDMARRDGAGKWWVEKPG